MRIRQLDLIAFGHFTNHSIDLSQGSHGLHMIYGPNEAGKSTSLRALTALLFDFPHRTDDNFKHENKNLRVGATLENRDGKQLACVRRKARSATLLFAENSEEVPLPLWNQFLPRIEESQFLQMFGLNHVSLREGGAELVRGGGDSGQALFSSASGIANLQQKRTWLDSQIEELYGKSGRKGRLYDRLKDYKSLRDEERKVSLTMDSWRRLESQLNDAKKQIDLHKSVLDSLQKSLLETQRIQRSIQTVNKYLDRHKALEALGQSSKLPEDFEQRVQQACKRKGEKQVSIESIEGELKSLDVQLSQIPDSVWNEQQDLRVDKLISGLGLYLQSLEELPKLRSQRDQLKRQATQKWQEIGSLDSLKNRLESERIPTSQKRWIETLAKQYEAYEKQIRDAQLRLSKLQKRLDADSNSQEPQANQESLRVLEQHVQQTRTLASRAQEFSQIEQEYQQLLKRVEQGVRKRNLSLQSAQELVDWTLVGTASIDRWEKEFDKRQEAIDKATSDLETLTKKMSSKRRELDREAKKSRVPTRQEWDTTKQARDEAFALLIEHRDATAERWTELVDMLRQSQQSADDIAAELLDQADLVAQREQLQEAVDELQAQVAESTATLENCRNGYEASKGAWQTFRAEHRIGPETPSEALEWVQAVMQLQRDAQDLLDKKHRMEQMQEAINRATVGLKEGLQGCGTSIDKQESFESLLAQAESVLRMASQERGKAEAFQKQRQLDQQEHQEQADDLKGLEVQFAELKKQWWEALASIALPEQATPIQVQTILDQISDLQQTTDQIESTQAFIKQCEEQVQSYESAVAIAMDWLSSRSPSAVAEFTEAGNAEAKVRFLERYGNQNSTHNSNRASIQGMHQQASERLAQAREEYKQIEKDLSDMIEYAGADTEERLLELARNSRQFHLLDTDRKELRERLQDECNNRDIEPFIEKVRQADPDQLAIQIKDLTEQINATDQAREAAIKLFSGLERDYQNLDTGGKSSMLASQASGVAIQIEEAVQELAILRLASAALAAGIERYRSANEDPILKLASESFSQMTLGRFRGIEIALDEDGKHLLVGKRDEDGPGSQVSVEQMSDGTRDQLFLALRLASLQQWNSLHEPMPLVFDDILIHFDDDRSVETLKQLVRVSDQTQVIFFTHHQHLIELAKEHLPADKLFLHELIPAF